MDLHAQPIQKARALDRHIPSSQNKCLSRRLLMVEQVVRSQQLLFKAFVGQVQRGQGQGRPAPCGDHYVFGFRKGNLLGFWKFLGLYEIL
jgi:hypothetical protein